MTELKIDPEFRDLIPKLTDEEFAQLEKNILADGRVKEPIVVWNGIIIDGHHRYYIVQKHPEIPYEIEERDFPNEYAAMAWACSNQLGRRNISENQRAYLTGKKYQNEELSHGSNQFQSIPGNSEQGVSNLDTPLPHRGRTVNKVAKELGIGTGTVQRYDYFSKGVDIAEAIAPGIKDEILNGDIKVPRETIQKISRVTPDIQRKAVEEISKGNIEAAKKALEVEKKPGIVGLHKADEEVEYTVDDLINEIRTNFKQYMSNIESTLNDHVDILEKPDCKDMVIFELTRIFTQEKEEIWRI